MQQHTFTCTNCQASLDYHKGMDKAVKCPYCGTTNIVPKELLTQEVPRAAVQQARAQQPVQVTVSQPSSGGCSWIIAISAILVIIIGAIAIVPILIAGGGIMAALSQFTNGESSTITINQSSVTQVSIQIPNSPTVTPTPGFMSEVLSFGGEGTGPGLLDDSRSIAVGADGVIYAADYDTGRVQVFDANGEYVTHWLIPDEPIILDIDADRQGNLYVVTGGHIYRYDGQTGEQNGELVADSYGFYDSIFVAADGSVVASSTPAGDTAIIVFAPDGSVKQVISDPIEGVTGDSELNTSVAMDGLGNIYAMGSFNGSVFAFNAQGQYQTRMGSQGTEEGQFRSLQDITVDGQGRIYVSDAMGIFVFEPDGRQIAFLEVDGVPFGMDFDMDGYLYVSNRDTITKYQLNE